MRSFFSISKNPEITSLAMGKFDGVHIAHQKLFEFLDHNGCVLVIDKPNTTCITPLSLRQKLIAHPAYLLEFQKIHSWDGKDFVAFLCEKLPRLQKIVVGYDFRFGKNKNYGADDLKSLFDGEVLIVPEIKMNAIPLHSTIIRELIGFGDIALANQLLGRHYEIFGEVVSGQNLGAKELYPTINIKTHQFVLPGNGVYASLTHIDSGVFASVCFVGNRLSTDRNFSIETHLLDKKITLKAKHIGIEFVQKIRDNRHFDSLSALKTQIGEDIAKARSLCLLDSLA
ncbi:bifunctional riboflavin kinase/FAD synthetase [Helicobacter sp. 11S02596-1]|uniref:bifunctional riboflavin kinase/FAD synthetase n=1 Tax=Helicobacter sp. 11S02596-1 TaxID=1476194 RepID=UPI000BA6EFA1|nr:bifunctional riboflavin kinase/FAD synthetase [Helicobacter sp. 11S02596-1]PAF44249.1 riboflavin biosynthesis protein RibF [Helicobacter sp. 11S02596-1]